MTLNRLRYRWLQILFHENKYRKHKYGGIHGVCIFIKTELAEYCYPLDNFESESILWIHIKHTFLHVIFSYELHIFHMRCQIIIKIMYLIT